MSFIKTLKLKEEITQSIKNKVLQNHQVNAQNAKSIYDEMSKNGTLDKEVSQELKDAANLNGTLAGSIAKKMDAEDGNPDGFIDSSVWNKYAGEHGGKEVKNKISTVNAMNSITTYIVREAANLKKAILAEIQKDIEKMQDETLAELEKMQEEQDKAKAKQEIENPDFGLQ